MVPRDELEGFQKRTSSRRTLVVGLIAAVALVAISLLLPGDRTDKGDSAPDFELPLLDGSGTLASEELEGSPTVVNFWASWCTPCREEAPLLERTWRAYRDDGVRFVGVNVQDTKQDAKAFVEEFRVTYPIVVDGEGELFGRMAQIDGLPQTFFIDDEWRFVAGEAGPRLGDERDTVTLGAITERELLDRVEILVESRGDN
jgi:cytochrome c biogenesis protein CcmG, thiol:disulfide interchange protein DsbE